MKTKTCKKCGELFEVTSRQYRNVFCSKSCSASYNNAGVNRHINIEPKLCPICSNPIDKRSNKYCSVECGKIGYKGYIDKKNPRTPKECENCSTMFYRANRTVKYCSIQCAQDVVKNNTIQNWIDNPDSATQRNGGLSVPIRKYLIKLASNKCSSCGWGEINQTTGVCPLEIDHIDGNSFNNNPENLRVLCPNCHALTSTYRALNKGKSTRVYYGSRVANN